MKYLISLLAAALLFSGCSLLRVNQAQPAGAAVADGFSESALCAAPWKLVKIETPQQQLVVPPNIEVSLVFNQKESRIHGRCCNSYFGVYTLNGNVLTLEKVGSTKMYCPGILSEIETLYLELIKEPLSVALKGKTMVLSSPEATITFEAFGID